MNSKDVRRHFPLRRVATLASKLLFAGALTLLLVELLLRLVGVRPVTAETVVRDPRELHPEEFIARAQREGWIPWPREVRRVAPVAEHPRGFVELRRNNVSCREDEDTSVSKADGVFRVIVLGDSNTDGICFNEESFANRLEANLNRSEAPRRFEVINTGFAQSSPYQQLWAYEQVFRRFQPDYVVMAFYAGNDLLELLRRDDRVHLEREGDQWVHVSPRGGADTTQTRSSLLESFRRAARDHSATYHALTRVTALRRLVWRASGDAYRERLIEAERLHSAPVWQGLNQAYYFQHHAGDWNDAASMQRCVLARLRDECLEDGIGFTLLILPTLRQIHPETDVQTLADTAALLKLDEASLDYDERACSLVAELADELRIDVIDLRPVFREARRQEADQPLYYRFDHHLNPAGHRLTADLLGSRVRERAREENERRAKN